MRLGWKMMLPAGSAQCRGHRDRDRPARNSPTLWILQHSSFFLFWPVSGDLVAAGGLSPQRGALRPGAGGSALLIIAILFVTLHAPMVGVLQVMVYAGAIMVLFLFVIMFLNPAVLERRRHALVGLRQRCWLCCSARLLVPLFSNNEAGGRSGGVD